MKSSIEITFNGEQREVTSTNLAELLDEFSLAGKKIAIELNREVVSRDTYRATILQNGDAVEIIQFVGGG